MQGDGFKINEGILTIYFEAKHSKLLYTYAVVSYLTAGKGYSTHSELVSSIMSFTKVIKRTAIRWIEKLKAARLIRIIKNVVYVKGRKKLHKLHTPTKTYIVFYKEVLTDYIKFQYHAIQQVALLIQRKFKHSCKKLRAEGATSLVQQGKIEAELAYVYFRRQMGCSISKVQEKLGINKMIISAALRGCTEKQYNYGKWVSGKLVRKKFRDLFDDLSPRYYNLKARKVIKKNFESRKNIKDYRLSYEYDSKKDSYRLKYSIASLIKVNSYLLNSYGMGF